MLEKDSFSFLDADNVSTQVTDLVLKEPIRKVTSLQEIHDGHTISNYVGALHGKDSSRENTEVTFDDAFEPQFFDKPMILWEQKGKNQREYNLIVHGKFLTPIMKSPKNCFEASPFKATSSYDIVSIS